MRMQHIQGLIVDWDGTVIDYGSQAAVRTQLEAIRRFGLAVSECEVRQTMGLPLKEHARATLHLPDVLQRFVDQFDRPPCDADVDEIYATVEVLLRDHLSEYADVIPGVLEFQREIRQRRIRIGSTSSYSQPMMERLIPMVHANGFAPDYLVTPDHVPAGRPAPWMCYLNAMQLNVYPLSRLVKIGDTVMDMQEGRNAGMWTIGVIRSGNEVGLTLDGEAELRNAELRTRWTAAQERLLRAGAHYTMKHWGEIWEVLDQIDARIAKGEVPGEVPHERSL